MGVSSTARLPNLSAQSIPALFNHLQTTSGAHVATRWSITIRSFRAVPVPANAYPRDDDQETDGQPSTSASTRGGGGGAGAGAGAGGGGGGDGGGPTPLTKPRTMWQIWISDYPGLVFVLVEDSGKISRARVWRDWEINKKQWRKARREEIEVTRKKEAEEEERKAQRAAIKAQDDAKAKELATDVDAETAKAEEHAAAGGSDDTAAQGAATSDQAPQEAQNNDGQPARAGGAEAATTSQTPTQETSPSQSQPQPLSQGMGVPAPAPVQADDDDVIMLEAGDPLQQHTTVKPAGAKPSLRLPLHTRLTLSVLSASLPALLSKLNLPPPHGAPVGTAGPGAWVPRGAAISIEGLVLDIGHFPSSSGGPSAAPSSGSSTDNSGLEKLDWRVRVGSVVGGGGRSAGAIIEAEFLPLETASPSAGFLTEFLQALLPPGLGPLTTTTIGGSGQTGGGGGGAANPANLYRGVGQLGGLAGYGNRSGMAASPLCGPAMVSNNVLKPPGSAAGASQNGAVTVPTISHQLWEEVVPRSGSEWKRIIERRSLVEEARTRQRKREQQAAAAPSASASSGAPPPQAEASPFDWHVPPPSDELIDLHAAANGAFSDVDTLTETDVETDAAPLAATAELGSDEDDDKPLGLLTAQAQAQAQLQAQAAASATTLAQPVRKVDGIRLHFEGLSGDLDRGCAGWSGIERGRRMAFTYVQLLRAEGLI